MQKLIEKNKKYIKFILIIIIVGIVSGFIYYYFLNDVLQLKITNTLNNYTSFRYNFILKDLIIMSFVLVLSFFVIGIPISIFYLFYEGLSIGFLINIFVVSFSIKGLLYVLLYLLINKILTLILKIIYIQKIINIGRYIIGLVIYKKDNLIKNKLVVNFKNSLYIIIFILIINVILYFISPLIFDKLSFLIN